MRFILWDGEDGTEEGGGEASVRGLRAVCACEEVSYAEREGRAYAWGVSALDGVAVRAAELG